MAQTTAIFDKPLSVSSSMYRPIGFISEEVLPLVTVKNKTGKFAKYGTNHLRIETTIAGGRGAYRRVDTIVRSATNYSVDTHGLEDVITEDDRDNVEEPYEVENDVVQGLTDLLYLKKEKGLADTLTSTTYLTQNVTLTGTDQYSDYTGSDPLDDFSTARSAVKTGTGMLANTAIMSWEVFTKIKFHPQLMQYLGYTYARPGGLTQSELVSIFEVDRILISSASYEAAAEGQTSNILPVWGKDIIFAAAPTTAARRQTSLGYRIQLSRMQPRRVLKYVINNPPNTLAITVDDAWDMFITNPNAAYLIKNAIA